MRYIISRRSVRGYPLDDDCRTAGVIREADGAGDPGAIVPAIKTP